MAVTGSALGADLGMPTKAPVMVPIPTYNWNGFYIGGHVRLRLGTHERRCFRSDRPCSRAKAHPPLALRVIGRQAVALNGDSSRTGRPRANTSTWDSTVSHTISLIQDSRALFAIPVQILALIRSDWRELSLQLAIISNFLKILIPPQAR
jgi:hypothetical protein